MSLCHFSVQFFRVSCCHDFSVIVFMTGLVPAHLSISFLWISAKHLAISHLQIFKPSVSFEIPISYHPKLAFKNRLTQGLISLSAALFHSRHLLCQGELGAPSSLLPRLCSTSELQHLFWGKQCYAG